MININLINSHAYVIGNYSKTSVKKTAGIFAAIIVLIFIPISSYFLAQNIIENREISDEDESVGVEPFKEIKTRAVSESIVEEIIDSVSKNLPKTAIGSKPYEEMTKWEKMDYEVKFNCLLLEELSKITPNGVLFNSIKISDYKLLVAEGTATDREMASVLFSRIKNDRWKLFPKPKTNIRDGGSFYYFRIEAEYYPTMSNFVKKPINPDNIPDRLHLIGVKEAVVKTVNSAGLKSQGLVLVKSQYEPDVKEYVYNINISGEFQNLLVFSKELAQMDVPVRNSEISIKNNGKSIEGVVKITIDVR